MANQSRRGFFKNAGMASLGVFATAAAAFVPEPAPVWAEATLEVSEIDLGIDTLVEQIENLQDLVLQMMANQAISMQANVMLAREAGFENLELPEFLELTLTSETSIVTEIELV